MRVTRSKMEVGTRYFMSRSGKVWEIKVVPNQIGNTYGRLAYADIRPGTSWPAITPGVYFTTRHEADNHARKYNAFVSKF